MRVWKRFYDWLERRFEIYALQKEHNAILNLDFTLAKTPKQMKLAENKIIALRVRIENLRRNRPNK